MAATQEQGAWSTRNTGGGLLGLILRDLGLSAADTISFSQFVLWLSAQAPGSDDNIHIMPWSVRCGAVEPSSYSMVGRIETFDADLQSLLGALHWDQVLTLTLTPTLTLTLTLNPTLTLTLYPNPNPIPQP